LAWIAHGLLLRSGMKNITSISLLIATAAALTIGSTTAEAGGLRIGSTPARKIAKDLSIPGKGVDGQCLPYALALHKRFQAAGIASKVIVYRYEAYNTAPGTFSGSAAYGSSATKGGAHAAVAYNDGGRIYLIDNQSWMPKWVSNDSTKGWAQQFSGMDINVLEAREYNTKKAIAKRSTSPSIRTKAPTPKAPKAPQPAVQPDAGANIPSYLTSR
jgi:hypothetical protein